MPTITLNKTVFEKLVGKKLPLDKLKDRISMMGTDLDSVSDKEITVEIFPNRPDMLSEQGFARAFSSFIGVKTGLRKYSVKDSKQKVIVEKSVSEVRPRTACAIVKGLKFDDEKIREVIQIQEKLHVTYGRNRRKCAIGIYPLEKIKMPITYKGVDPKKIKFVPLESTQEMNGNDILEVLSTGKEFAHLLKGAKVFPIFEDANGQVLSMPPIINSHNVGKITEKTKDVFIECSGFDFDTLVICLNIIVTTLSDMGGQIYSIDLQFPDSKKATPDLNPQKMKLDDKYINRRLGLNLKQKELVKLLEKMGYGWDGKNVLIPAYRADIMHQVDLVEDVAIAYGFENFEDEIPQVSTIAAEDPLEIFKKKIIYLLTGLQFLELNTYNISSDINQNEKMLSDLKLVQLANALNEDANVLRAWIIPSLMEVFNTNKHHDYPQKIFDIGTIFKHDKKKVTETNVIENDRLAVAICSESANYTEIRQVLEYILNQLGLNGNFKETEHPSFIPGRVARVSVEGKDVAYVGEIHPQVLENWDLQLPVAACELNVSELFELIK